MDGNSELFKGKGWSSPEIAFEWNNGEEAELLFHIDVPPKDLVFEFEFYPFIRKGKIDKQCFQLFANNHKIGEWEIKSPSWTQIKSIITQDNIDSNFLKIKFKFLNSTSPKQIGEGTDARKLAIAIKKVIISEI